MFSINRSTTRSKKRQNFMYPTDDLCLPGGTDHYRLIGVIIHNGPDRDSGHYYAIVRYESGIYKCNDHRISPLDPDASRSMSCPDAYILIYKKTTRPADCKS